MIDSLVEWWNREDDEEEKRREELIRKRLRAYRIDEPDPEPDPEPVEGPSDDFLAKLRSFRIETPWEKKTRGRVELLDPAQQAALSGLQLVEGGDLTLTPSGSGQEDPKVQQNLVGSLISGGAAFGSGVSQLADMGTRAIERAIGPEILGFKTRGGAFEELQDELEKTSESFRGEGEITNTEGHLFNSGYGSILRHELAQSMTPTAVALVGGMPGMAANALYHGGAYLEDKERESGEVPDDFRSIGTALGAGVAMSALERLGASKMIEGFGGALTKKATGAMMEGITEGAQEVSDALFKISEGRMGFGDLFTPEFGRQLAGSTAAGALLGTGFEGVAGGVEAGVQGKRALDFRGELGQAFDVGGQIIQEQQQLDDRLRAIEAILGANRGADDFAALEERARLGEADADLMLGGGSLFGSGGMAGGLARAQIEDEVRQRGWEAAIPHLDEAADLYGESAETGVNVFDFPAQQQVERAQGARERAEAQPVLPQDPVALREGVPEAARVLGVAPSRAYESLGDTPRANRELAYELADLTGPQRFTMDHVVAVTAEQQGRSEDDVWRDITVRGVESYEEMQSVLAEMRGETQEQGTLFQIDPEIKQELDSTALDTASLDVARLMGRSPVLAEGEPEKMRKYLAQEYGAEVGAQYQEIFERARRVRADYEARGLLEDDPRFFTEQKSGRRTGSVPIHPQIRNQLDYDAVVDKATRYAILGKEGYRWYENSSEEILRISGGNVEEAKLIAKAIAITSAQTPVPENWNQSIRAYYQWKAGKEITAASTGDKNAKLNRLFYDGQFELQQKTNNFYRNLVRLIDPKGEGAAIDQGVTVDVHMMRALGWGKETPNTPLIGEKVSKEYALGAQIIKEVADRFGWEPQQAQAAIWVAQKHLGKMPSRYRAETPREHRRRVEKAAKDKPKGLNKKIKEKRKEIAGVEKNLDRLRARDDESLTTVRRGGLLKVLHEEEAKHSALSEELSTLEEALDEWQTFNRQYDVPVRQSGRAREFNYQAKLGKWLRGLGDRAPRQNDGESLNQWRARVVRHAEKTDPSILEGMPERPSGAEPEESFERRIDRYTSRAPGDYPVRKPMETLDAYQARLSKWRAGRSEGWADDVGENKIDFRDTASMYTGQLNVEATPGQGRAEWVKTASDAVKQQFLAAVEKTVDWVSMAKDAGVLLIDGGVHGWGGFEGNVNPNVVLEVALPRQKGVGVGSRDPVALESVKRLASWVAHVWSQDSVAVAQLSPAGTRAERTALVVDLERDATADEVRRVQEIVDGQSLPAFISPAKGRGIVLGFAPWEGMPSGWTQDNWFDNMMNALEQGGIDEQFRDAQSWSELVNAIRGTTEEGRSSLPPSVHRARQEYEALLDQYEEAYSRGGERAVLELGPEPAAGPASEAGEDLGLAAQPPPTEGGQTLYQEEGGVSDRLTEAAYVEDWRPTLESSSPTKGVKGSLTRLDPADTRKAVLILTKGKADFSTLAHELFHYTRPHLPEAAQRELADWAGEEGWEPGKTWSVQGEERAARGFERFIMRAAKYSEDVDPILEDMREWMLEIYGEEGALDDLAPEARAQVESIFSELVGADVDMLPATTIRERIENRRSATQVRNRARKMRGIQEARDFEASQVATRLDRAIDARAGQVTGGRGEVVEKVLGALRGYTKYGRNLDELYEGTEGEALKDAVEAARAMVTEESEALLRLHDEDTKVFGQDITRSRNIRAKIEENLGKYLRREYEIDKPAITGEFGNRIKREFAPGEFAETWAEHILNNPAGKKLRADARRYLKSEEWGRFEKIVKKDPSTTAGNLREKVEDAIDAELNSYLRLAPDNLFTGVPGEFGPVDMGRLTERKALPPAIKKYLGEIRDPVRAFRLSIANQVAIRTEHEAFKELIGDDQFFADAPKKKNWVQIQGKGILDGKYTSPEIAEALRGTLSISDGSIMRTLRSATALMKAGATVGNPGTHFVNYTANYLYHVANGYFPTRRGASAWSKAHKLAARQILKKDFKGDEAELMRDMIQRGVLGDAISLETMKQVQGARNRGGAIGKALGAFTLGDLGRDFYMQEDEVHKAAAYLFELARLERLGVTGEAAKNYAAEVVSETMPTWSRVRGPVRILRETGGSGLFGRFGGFVSETVRNGLNNAFLISYHSAKAAGKDAEAERWKAFLSYDIPDIPLSRSGHATIAAQRAAGMASAYAAKGFLLTGILGMGGALAGAIGIGDDDDEEAAAGAAPDWMAGSHMMVLRREDGKVWVTPADKFDSFDFPKELFGIARDFVTDDEVDLEHLRQIGETFWGESLAINQAINVWRGQDDFGRKIPRLSLTEKSAVGNAMLAARPGWVKGLWRVAQAGGLVNTDRPLASFGAEAQGFFTGQKPYAIELDSSAQRAAYDFQRANRAARKAWLDEQSLKEGSRKYDRAKEKWKRSDEYKELLQGLEDRFGMILHLGRDGVYSKRQMYKDLEGIVSKEVLRKVT